LYTIEVKGTIGTLESVETTFDLQLVNCADVNADITFTISMTSVIYDVSMSPTYTIPFTWSYSLSTLCTNNMFKIVDIHDIPASPHFIVDPINSEIKI